LSFFSVNVSGVANNWEYRKAVTKAFAGFGGVGFPFWPTAEVAKTLAATSTPSHVFLGVM
jgi:hypothetical protein